MGFKKLVVLALFIGAAACSSSNKELEAKEVADTSAQLAGALVRDAGSSAQLLTSLDAVQSALAQVPATGGTGGTPVPPAAPASGALHAATLVAAQPAVQRSLSSARSWLSTALVDPSSGTEQAASDLETFLRTRVFTGANRESGDADSATFLLHGNTFCDDGVLPVDPACVSTIDDLQIRIKATKAGGGFDFALLVGPNRANPVTLGLRPGSLSVTIDLGGIKATAEQIALVTGRPIDLPAVMEGSFRLAVNKLGEAHVSLVASVLSAIHLRVEAVDGPYDFTTQPADPLASIEADAVAGVLTVKAGLAATTVLMPYLVNVAAASPSGFTTFGIDLGGLSWTVRATVAAKDRVDITGLGLGATQTRVWAEKSDLSVVDAVTVDLTGGPIDVIVTDDPLAGTTVRSTPFDLSVYLGLGQLDLDTPASVGTVDDTYAVGLLADASNNAPVLFIPLACDQLVATCPTLEPSLQIVTGSLELTKTDPAAVVTTVTVAAPDCLFDDGTGTLTVDVCP